MDIQMNRTHKVNGIISLKAETVLNGILLAASFLFYLLFPLLDGPVWCVDSASYVTMDISREPLYPTFLALARNISGGGIPGR